MAWVEPASFEVQESCDSDGTLRLSLIGELDLAGKDQLEAVLGRLRRSRTRVRIDLSRLDFIDSSGLRLLVTAVHEARLDDRALAIEPTLVPQVRRLIGLVGVTALLWPSGVPDVSTADAAHVDVAGGAGAGPSSPRESPNQNRAVKVGARGRWRGRRPGGRSAPG